jgi:2-dehydro-3-deoxy-D-arabinonate dehydratase
MPARDQTEIHLSIKRGGDEVFAQGTRASEMARTYEDLVDWLGRDNSFPQGAILLTGTGIVPNSDFTLHPGDMVSISISGIGMLRNSIVQGY